MKWSDVGEWLQSNAGSGAALVGSLLTGNVPGAVAAGVAMVSSATGHATATEALAALQGDPSTVVKLKELAVQDAENVRRHIQTMAEIAAKDAQAEHEETGKTIRAGDKAEDRFVRWTRPGQSWLSLLAAFWYVHYCTTHATAPGEMVLGILLTLPWAYAGLRQFGKWHAAEKEAGK